MVFSKRPFLKTIFFLAILCFSIVGKMSATSNPWTEARERDFATSNLERQIIPNEYLTYALNFNQLQELLSTAPMRFTTAQSDVVLNLPMPNGEMERFQIFDAPIMESELAAKYPMLHAYAGVGVDDPTATLRLDVTQHGFHAMVISARNGSAYIDPYAKGDTEHYISYYKKNLNNTNTSFKCHHNGETNTDVAPNDLPDFQGDCMLRTYRAAISTTGEYTQFHGGTVADALAAIHTSLNRVNSIFEREVGLTMVLVNNNDQIIFINPNTDPFTNNDGSAMLDENQPVVDNAIGAANYDIGHVFSTGGGGIAYVSSPCSSIKAKGVTGLPTPVGGPFDVDYVAHEIGHQFGANHTQNNDNCNRNDATAMEPGSGSTIMGYAGVCAPYVQFSSDEYFHSISIQEITDNMLNGWGSVCPELTSINNNQPTASAGANYTLPISTPFKLEGTATDQDGDMLTYLWEQRDNEVATMPPASTSTGGPAFRSFDPVEENFRYFPKLENIINNTSDDWEVLPSVSRMMNFRMTVKDNHQGSGCTDEDDVVLNFSNTAGPFLVETPNTNMQWSGGTTQNVTWDIANTNTAPVSCANVDIMLSIDGGYTWTTTLAQQVPNTGLYGITVPNIDANMCRVMVVCSDNIFFDMSNTNFSISQTSNSITAAATAVMQVSCFGGSNGSITATVTGGMPPFQYSLDGVDFQNEETFANLSTGTYTIIVKDANNNLSTANTVTLTSPTEIIVSTITSGDEITVTVSGGSGNYFYSINGVDFQSSPIFPNVKNGQYTILVKDTNGCSKFASATVSSILGADINSLAASCVGSADGILTVTNVNGGIAPYLYSTNGNDFQSSNQLEGLSAGTYSIFIMDSSGAEKEIGNYVVNDGPALSVNGISGNGTITANGQGGTGVLMYSIDGVNFQENNIFMNLTNNVYTLSVLDENGCVATDMVTIGTTGINELDFDLNFNLYPNPSNGRFTISMNQPTGKEITIQIYDVVGKLVQEFLIEKNNDIYEKHINVSHLSSGSYEVLISDDQFYGRKRFIILD